MKVSICITTFKEEKETIDNLLNALKKQTVRPDEIIIIDAKDHDNCSRSKGRNIAIKKAKNEVVALTDVGCVPHPDWLEKITKQFRNKKVDVVAGGYNMVFANSFEKAESVFLGVKQKDMDLNFMPSTRSMALTKTIWKKAGGFPEELDNTAEDTMFNLNLLKVKANFVVVKGALVDWQMPKTLTEFIKKIYNYAKGDAQSKIWWHPVKKWQTHNIKILTIFLRYVFFILFPPLFIVYLLYAYIKAGIWGIILQISSDFAGIIGFSHGILQTGI